MTKIDWECFRIRCKLCSKLYKANNSYEEKLKLCPECRNDKSKLGIARVKRQYGIKKYKGEI